MGTRVRRMEMILHVAGIGRRCFKVTAVCGTRGAMDSSTFQLIYPFLLIFLALASPLLVCLI